MKALLKDTALQAQLNADGFISTPFLNQQELESIRTFYKELHPTGEAPQKIDGIHMTTWCSDFNYKMQVADFLSKTYERACEAFFEDYRRLNDVFIVKDPRAGTTFKVHQDWNVVDEVDDFAINIWVPLYDVDESNGALWVVKGSHNIDRHTRGSAYLFPDYSPFFKDLEAVATSVNLKAGHAVIFYMNAIHGSPQNNGENPRIATCFSVVPKDAPLRVYFQKKAGDPLQVHEPQDDFMYHYEHLRTDTLEFPPTDTPIEVLPSYVNTPVTRKELRFCLKPNQNWFRRLFFTS